MKNGVSSQPRTSQGTGEFPHVNLLKIPAIEDAGAAKLPLEICMKLGNPGRRESDYGEAFRWTKMAAEQGRAFDANRLAGYLWEGLGVPMNKEEAIHWLKIAVKQGDAKSQKQIPVWTAAWESEKKQRLDKSDRSKSGAEAKSQPGLWRVAGPWKIPHGDAPEWFSKVDFVGVSGSLAKGCKSIFLGEEREVLEVDALEVGNFANSLGMHADRIALVQGRWNVKKAGKALLAVGSDDAIKVWVNGKLAASDWVGRKVTAYEDLYPIEIREGENEIHAIVINFQGPWGFLLSVPDEATKARLLAEAIRKGDYNRVKTLLEVRALTFVRKFFIAYPDWNWHK